MSGRTHAIFVSVVLLLIAWWWFFEREPAALEGSTDTVEVQDGVPAETSGDGGESQRQYADRQSGADDLSRRVADKEKRDRAGAQTVEYRKGLQMSRDGDWQRFLNPRKAEYKALRAKAVADPHGTTPCTICNGRGSMDDCFLCGSTGKCPTCKGTGQVSADGYCPTCLGSGKCFHCNGTGKLVCPFCDDGDVYAKAPPVPSQLPINY